MGNCERCDKEVRDNAIDSELYWSDLFDGAVCFECDQHLTAGALDGSLWETAGNVN